jgi:hypothetical protein
VDMFSLFFFFFFFSTRNNDYLPGSVVGGSETRNSHSTQSLQSSCPHHQYLGLHSCLSNVQFEVMQTQHFQRAQQSGGFRRSDMVSHSLLSRDPAVCCGGVFQGFDDDIWIKWVI